MTTPTSTINLVPTDSASSVKEFFNKFFVEPISYPANQVDAVVGYFEKRGFDTISATGVATVLLQQAKIDNVNVFKLLDTLKGISDVQLSQVVAEILNYNRSKVSTLGYKINSTSDRTESRNIVDNSPPAPALINNNNFSATGFTFDSITNTWDGE
jgi:hypothetical protein